MAADVARATAEGRLSALRDALIAAQADAPWSRADVDDPVQLLGRLWPSCRRYGITRVGDLTGLDRIGLPVAQAVRPEALSEVTALGRGFSKAEAAVGAIMEVLERFFAESIESDRVFVAAADDLDLAPDFFEHVVVPQRKGNWRHLHLPWTMALDVATGDPEPVPMELVHTRYSDPPPIGDGVFLRSTTGLACHRSAYEAFLHGLFECIERDAIARAFATHGFFDRHRLQPFAAYGTRGEHLLKLADNAGLSVALWHAPSPAKVAVVWCQTIETGPAEPILGLPTEGYGAGPSLESAMANALSEALAVRAGAISGARDDQTLQHYKARSNASLIARARDLILADPASADAEPIDNFEPFDLLALVQNVAASGLGPVLAVPVGSDDELGVHCVRTIAAKAHTLSIVR